MTDPQKQAMRKILGGVLALLAAAGLAIFGAHQIKGGVEQYRAAVEARGDSDATIVNIIPVPVQSEAKEKGTFTINGKDSENGLYNGGQTAYLNTYLRGVAAPAGCYLFLMSSAMSAPGKTATMGTVTPSELTAVANPGYGRLAVTFGVPTLDAGSGDMYSVTPVTSWVPSGNWGTTVGWIGLVCGSAASGTIADTSGTLVSLAQITPAKTISSTDVLATIYRMWQR
jgi:hypothetical protein